MNTLFLNNPSHTFVIAEAGSNWKAGTPDEDIKRAKDLIRIASSAGADAVKFQTYKSATVYASNAGTSNYLSQHGIKDNINDIFHYLSMPYEMIPELSEYCEKENIIFMSTPFSIEDAKNIDPYVKLHKVASYEINHIRLLEFLAKTGKPVIISTGASTYTEIDFAVSLVRSSNDKIGLMQCTAKYPSPLEALNLTVIPHMKERYHIPVGLSDHSLDPLIGPILAIGLGATIIEKHFTIDKNLPGPDHPFALNPNELKIMIDAIRQADLAKGSGRKEILSEEYELRYFATRSLQATAKISKGDILKEGFNFDVLRPGNRTRGLDARFLTEVNGKKAIKDIEIGEGIIEYE